ncbi:MAG: DUF2167 domain-containing protein [Planctomycetes bacterium]|nr:DUF2167 domain-containing protein [Planctomycetota bacterium]
MLSVLAACSFLLASSQEAPTPDASQKAAQEPSRAEMLQVLSEAANAKPGPLTGAIGRLAEVAVPEGLAYADAEGARNLLAATGNLPDDSVLAGVLSLREESDWFVLFSFDESGYVKDEEKDELDADDLLDKLREGNEQGNAIRKERGLDTLELVGWEKEPFYDPKTNNLTWGTRIKSSAGGESVNWQVRLLGRRGVMSAELVIAPQDLQAGLPSFDALLAGYSFKEGHKYAEFRSGDKIAEYGLGALVVGGAGFAALKLGFFSKFWKLILVGVAAMGAAIKNFWSKLFGKKERDAGGPPPLQG